MYLKYGGGADRIPIRNGLTPEEFPKLFVIKARIKLYYFYSAEKKPPPVLLKK
jgi:hypothetical protein